MAATQTVAAGWEEPILGLLISTDNIATIKVNEHKSQHGVITATAGDSGVEEADASVMP